VQDRGLAAYIAELIGTFLLVFFLTSVTVLFVSLGSQAQFGSDYAVVGLASGFALLGIYVMFQTVSGGHFNPAITFGAAILRKIDPIDAVVYILAQLSGAVLGALLTKGLLLDEGRATNYGAAQVSGLLSGNTAGAAVEALGAFCLVLVFCAVFFSKRGPKEYAPLAMGATLTFLVMVGGPLTGASYNPARWFGPALVANSFPGAWLYIVGPLVGSLLAVLVFRFVVEAEPPAARPAKPPKQPAKPAAKSGAAESTSGSGKLGGDKPSGSGSGDRPDAGSGDKPGDSS
jgi:MIP family channel proteins